MDRDNRVVDLNVRFKNKRTRSSTKPQPSPNTQNSQTGQKRKGRPMKSATELRNAKKAKREAPPLPPPPKQKSWLERLPVELIEQIFFHSLEVNMARASPFIGKVLAKESVYKALILFAFFQEPIPPYQVEYFKRTCPIETKHFAPATYRTLTDEQRKSLQRDILCTRWCTSKRIEHQLPTLTRLLLVHRWHTKRAIELWPQDEAGLAAGVLVLSDEKEVPTKLPDLADDQALMERFSGSGFFAEQDFCNTDGHTSMIFLSKTALQCLPSCILDPKTWSAPSRQNSPGTTPNSSRESTPDRSTGQVDAESVKILQLLLTLAKPKFMSDAVDHYHSLLGGIETAIREQNDDVLGLLTHVTKAIFLHAGSDLDPFSYGNEWMRLVRLATQQPSRSRLLLEELFDALPYKLVDRDDSVLMKWALQNNDPKCSLVNPAGWLLEKRFKCRYRDLAACSWNTSLRIETEEDEARVSYPELTDEDDRLGGWANVARFMDFSDSDPNADEDSYDEEYEDYLTGCEEGPDDSNSEDDDDDGEEEGGEEDDEV